MENDKLLVLQNSKVHQQCQSHQLNVDTLLDDGFQKDVGEDNSLCMVACALFSMQWWF